MKQENGNSGQKRISFLMPYIDFCFMLIIIFVGMLSIAYFEPLGLTDVQTAEDKTIDQSTGRRDVVPPGMEKRLNGVGASTENGAVVPLIDRQDQQSGYRSPAAGATDAAGTGAHPPPPQTGFEQARPRPRRVTPAPRDGTTSAPIPQKTPGKGPGDGPGDGAGLGPGKGPGEGPGPGGAQPGTDTGQGQPSGAGASNHLYLDLRGNND